MSYHLTIATCKVEGRYCVERVISEQQRVVLQSLQWLVFIFPLLPVCLHKTCVCFCDVLQVQAVLKRKEEEDQQMQQLIQALQASLEKEKLKVKDLQKQVMLIFYLFTK